MIKNTIKPASRFKRYLASIIDSIILSIPYAFFIFYDMSGAELNLFVEVGIFLIIFSPIFLYFPLFERSRYCSTPGKMIFKMRVLTDDGKRLSFWKSSIRYLLSILLVILINTTKDLMDESYYLILMCALMSIYTLPIYFTKDRKLLHDIITGTKVVKIETKGS